ncbi:hypothetical protein IAQ61_010421 [Plenodomus lingam]|uniref:Predicted protein n=1 Tax=Leptosphaeria maculans (strain JN3 / isolate v23.1.3 / race Av1-4-5-6-7-8) TaxID=985895 RepID=E5A3X6_LEPMJ|nr:predicted protein [Plenodomus lingam JN3]KAH9862218.1 hypothetical protein IAQ61_010421 [Plenodomus lingam]CBX98321.1 predicted protein [Plenodomus lingam JN3]
MSAEYERAVKHRGHFHIHTSTCCHLPDLSSEIFAVKISNGLPEEYLTPSSDEGQEADDDSTVFYIYKSPTEVTEVFHSYLQWLYTDHITVKYYTSQETNEKGEEMTIEQPSLMFLIRCHLLGDKIMDGAYQAAAMRTLICNFDKDKAFPFDVIVSWIYQVTPPGSPLRKLMVDFWSWEVRQAHTAWNTHEIVQDTSMDFTHDFIENLLNEQPVPGGMPPWVAAPWKYGSMA